MEAMMLDRIVEVFCEVDDFCQAFLPQWEASLLGTGGPAPRGPHVDQRDHHAAAHSSGFKHLKSFYHGFAEPLATFPACRATSTSSPCRKVSSCRWCSSSSATWGPGSTTSIPPPCDNHRRHKVFADLAQRGKTGWFFGFKLHLVFNNRNEIVALKLTPGNVHDTTPALTRDLIGKLFGDKGYISWRKTCCVAG